MWRVKPNDICESCQNENKAHQPHGVVGLGEISGLDVLALQNGAQYDYQCCLQQWAVALVGRLLKQGQHCEASGLAWGNYWTVSLDLIVMEINAASSQFAIAS